MEDFELLLDFKKDFYLNDNFLSEGRTLVVVPFKLDLYSCKGKRKYALRNH